MNDCTCIRNIECLILNSGFTTGRYNTIHVLWTAHVYEYFSNLKETPGPNPGFRGRYPFRPLLKDFAFAVTRQDYFVMGRQAGSEIFFIIQLQKVLWKHHVVTRCTWSSIARLRHWQTILKNNYTEKENPKNFTSQERKGK